MGSHSIHVPEMGDHYSHGMQQRPSNFDHLMNLANPQTNDRGYHDSECYDYGSNNALQFHGNESTWSPKPGHNGYNGGLSEGLNTGVAGNNGMGMPTKRRLEDDEYDPESLRYSSTTRRMKKPRLGERPSGGMQHQESSQSGLEQSGIPTPSNLDARFQDLTPAYGPQYESMLSQAPQDLYNLTQLPTAPSGNAAEAHFEPVQGMETRRLIPEMAFFNPMLVNMMKPS